MFASIAQLFRALFMLGTVAERTMLGVDNLAKVGQAHSARMLKDTLEDLKISEADLELDDPKATKEPAAPAETKAE